MKKSELTKNLLTMGNPSSTPNQIRDAWAQHPHDKTFMIWLKTLARDYAHENYHMTQDLVQEGLLQIRLAAPQYKANGCPFGWRVTVVKNRFIDLTRKQEGKWNYPLQFRNGNGIEKFIGDDPSFPPEES
jgi:DNA-directed RNA polymerase specialized sigma24 family protein